MNKEINSILSLFADTEEFNTKFLETWDEFECKCTLTLQKIPKGEELCSALPHISNRDSWRLIIESKYNDNIFDDLDLKLKYPKTILMRPELRKNWSRILIIRYL